MNKSTILIKMMSILLMGSAMISCNKKESQEEGGGYKTMVVAPRDCNLEREYTARLQGTQVVEIRPQVSGTITRICFEEGDRVRRGEVLFIIDQVPYRAALAEARANVSSAQAKLATARLDYESMLRLKEKDVVKEYDVSAAANTLAAAKAALAQAEAQEVTARNNLSYTEVKSPVDGVAGMIAYRVGALVSSSIATPLVTVSDDSRMQAYFSLSENEVIDLIGSYNSPEAYIAAKQEVGLRLSNGELYDRKGVIAAVSGIVTEGTGAVTLRADFDNSGMLRDGASGSVVIATPRKGCLVIPQTATYELQEKIMVYRVRGGKAVSTPVRVTRLSNGTEYIVEEGLAKGDTIIAEGAGLVKEGATIK
ncbi:MAG: efflux RND transporter periplasmic adaptor subunit [Lepagella sp.]